MYYLCLLRNFSIHSPQNIKRVNVFVQIVKCIFFFQISDVPGMQASQTVHHRAQQCGVSRHYWKIILIETFSCLLEWLLDCGGSLIIAWDDLCIFLHGKKKVDRKIKSSIRSERGGREFRWLSQFQNQCSGLWLSLFTFFFEGGFHSTAAWPLNMPSSLLKSTPSSPPSQFHYIISNWHN